MNLYNSNKSELAHSITSSIPVLVTLDFDLNSTSHLKILKLISLVSVNTKSAYSAWSVDFYTLFPTL